MNKKYLKKINLIGKFLFYRFDKCSDFRKLCFVFNLDE